VSQLDKNLECLCPVCGADNQCAMADDKQASQCWCMGVTIAEEALAQIPAKARDTQCLCAACARYQGEQNNGG
jgi:hypothetical protein